MSFLFCLTEFFLLVTFTEAQLTVVNTLSFYSQIQPNPQVEMKNEGTLLNIERLSLEHAGIYKCQASKKMGSIHISATFELLVECKFM